MYIPGRCPAPGQGMFKTGDTVDHVVVNVNILILFNILSGWEMLVSDKNRVLSRTIISITAKNTDQTDPLEHPQVEPSREADSLEFLHGLVCFFTDKALEIIWEIGLTEMARRNATPVNCIQ